MDGREKEKTLVLWDNQVLGPLLELLKFSVENKKY